MLSLFVAGFLVIAPTPSPCLLAVENRDVQEPGHSNYTTDPNALPLSLAANQEGERGAKEKKEHGSGCPVVQWIQENPDAFMMEALTLCLVIATFALWSSGKRHSRHELRAYVFPATVGITKLGSSTPVVVQIEVKNMGKTPAYDVRFWFELMVAPFPQTVFKVGNFREDSGSLGPGAIFQVTCPFPSGLPWESHYQEIKAGMKAVYINGQIRYRDVFRKTEHFTNYRGFFRGDGTIPEEWPLKLIQTPDGNNSS